MSDFRAAARALARRCLPLAVGLLLVLLAYRSLITGSVYLPGDTYFSVFPLLSAVSSALKDFQLPLWEPFVRRGVPLSDLLGIPIWSPLTLLLALVGYTVELLNVQFLVIALAGGAFMYLALGRWVADPWLRAAGAVAYATSGIYIGNAQHLTFISATTLLPLLHFAVFRWLDSGSRRAALLVGATVALLVTNGYPPFVVLVLSFLLIEAVVGGALERAWRRSPWHRWIAGIAVASGSSVALSWVALVTTLQISTRTTRAGAIPWEDVANNGLHPLNWAAVIAPSLVELIPRWTFYLEPSMRNTYIATPLVLLCLVSPVVLYRVMNRRQLAALMLLAVVSVLITVGHHTAFYRQFVYDFLPLMNLFRFPGGLRFFAFFYGVVLGCACADALGRGHAGRAFDAMKVVWLAALVGAVVLLHGVRAPAPLWEAGLSLAALLLLVIALERRWTTVRGGVFAAVAVFSVYGAWRNPDHGLGSEGRPTGYDAELAAVYRAGRSNVPNVFVQPTVFGAFSILERKFETAGYIGTLELTSYYQARITGLLPQPGDPVLSWVPAEGVPIRDGVPQVDIRSTLVTRSAPAQLRVGVNEIGVTLELPTRSYVLLEQNAYPGWMAFVDGSQRELVSTPSGAMALPVEAGRHEAVFTFRPGMIIASFWVTAAAWLLALAIGIAALARSFTTAGTPTPPAPASPGAAACP